MKGTTLSEITQFSTLTLARQIREGALSSTAVVEAHLQRIQEVNPRLNAVVHLTAETARTEARAADAALARGELRGPLHGVPMTIKDSFETAGVLSTCGTLGLARHVPREDATVVARLKSAGAILLGKTNTPELTLAFETDNLLHGRTNNPYDPSLSSGGSSGGAAAIVSAGGAPFDLGSDTGGSIRLPVHFCGVAGLKPTSGRVPRTGHLYPGGGYRDSWTTIGPIARMVEDLGLLFSIIAGPDGRDPSIVPMPLGDSSGVELATLRVAFYTDNGVMAPTPETAETVRAAARTLEAAGCAVTEDRPPQIELTAPLVGALWDVDGGAAIRELLQGYGTKRPHPLLAAHLDAWELGSAADLGMLLQEQDRFRSRMLRFMEDYDLILCPVCAFPAAPHGSCQTPEYWSGYDYMITYNVTGWPVAVVRCGFAPTPCPSPALRERGVPSIQPLGLPVGVQVVARPWREDVALAAATHLEAVFGGWRPPPGAFGQKTGGPV